MTPPKKPLVRTEAWLVLGIILWIGNIVFIAKNIITGAYGFLPLSVGGFIVVSIAIYQWYRTNKQGD